MVVADNNLLHQVAQNTQYLAVAARGKIPVKFNLAK